MTLESDTKFKENLTCGLENDMRNLGNFHQSTFIGTFKGSMYQPKIYRGVMCHDNEEGCKI